ncbi:hypothetical protein EXIGLDRAFT_720804 [Exidia glandulosa HHB12029]|uniref:Uncharacterized protein n=1 Tax=Exidia glandulosa HHB12029 TaxID=1314781 RepID=A0A165G4S0_EXIGL|nr:hypothetical protein EXIGLDRAFT_720804 [Exidia glandulosa HHB12029]
MAVQSGSAPSATQILPHPVNETLYPCASSRPTLLFSPRYVRVLYLHLHRSRNLGLRRDRFSNDWRPNSWRIRASQTCSSIRRAALATPDLWTSVKIGPSVQQTYGKDELAEERAKNWTSFTGALSVINRSSGAGFEFPARAFVSFAASCLQDYSSIACVQDLLRRVTTLRFEPYSQGTVRFSSPGPVHEPPRAKDVLAPISASEWRSVADVLCTNAPLLEFLDIAVPRSLWSYVTEDTDCERRIPDDILAGEAGQLRTCRLDGFLVGRAPAFSCLTSFDYRPSPDTISRTDITRIMDQMPVLQTLGLCGRFPMDDRELASLPASRHQCLSRVALAIPNYVSDVASGPHVNDNVSCLVDFFREVCSRSDLHFIADFRQGRDIYFLGQTAPFPSHVSADIKPPRRIVATHDVSILQDDFVILLASHVRVLDGLLTTSTGGAIDCSFLVQVTIGDMYWPEFARLSVSAPQLKGICISLLLCSTAGTDVTDVESMFTATEARACPSLNCPALETFTVSCTSRSDRWGRGSCYMEMLQSADRGPTPFRCACRNGGIFSLTEVHALIINSIRLSVPLRQLRLMGVHATIDIDPVAAFLLITSIADDVLVSKDVAQEVLDVERLQKQQHEENAQFWAPSHSFDTLRTSAFTV